MDRYVPMKATRSRKKPAWMDNQTYKAVKNKAIKYKYYNKFLSEEF